MQILKQQFTEVIPSKVVQLGTINFYPIYFKFQNLASNLISLDELFDRKLLRINEVNFNGSVGQVEVTNDSRYYLYILDGEAISGAKQNRIAERSVIIAPYSSTIVPVNCVERGRWNYNSQNFSKSEFVLHPKARDEKAELLKIKKNIKFKTQFGVKLMNYLKNIKSIAIHQI